MIFLGMQPGSRGGLMYKDDLDTPPAPQVVWGAPGAGMQAK